jgi:hypothetical protein
MGCLAANTMWLEQFQLCILLVFLIYVYHDAQFREGKV